MIVLSAEMNEMNEMNTTANRDSLSAQSEDSPLDLLDVLVLLAENKKTLLLVPIVVGLVALAATFLVTPKFAATASLMTPQQPQSSAAALLGSLAGLGSVAGGAGGALAGLKNPADQWVGLLQSRTIADAMIEKFSLRTRYDVDYQFQARKELAARTDITAGKDSLIQIEVVDQDPEVAAKMARNYVDELQKLSKTLAMTEAAQRRAFFESQLKDAKMSLTKAEQALQGAGVNMGALKASPEAAVGAMAELQARVVATEVRLSVMRQYLTENTPEVRQLIGELRALREQLASQEKNDVSGDKSVNSEYIGRYRDFKYYETLYDLLARQYEMARSDEARDGAVIQVVDEPVVPEWKSSPKRALIAGVAAGVALLLTVVYLLLRESIRHAAIEDPVAAGKLQRLLGVLRWSKA